MLPVDLLSILGLQQSLLLEPELFRDGPEPVDGGLELFSLPLQARSSFADVGHDGVDEALQPAVLVLRLQEVLLAFDQLKIGRKGDLRVVRIKVNEAQSEENTMLGGNTKHERCFVLVEQAKSWASAAT